MEETSSNSKTTEKVSPLRDQIGDVIDFDTAFESAEGKELLSLLEEAFADNPKGIRTAKWIDELPAELPSPPPLKDILPVIPIKELVSDVKGANAHWEAFQERNPKTATFLINEGVQPDIKEMPGLDVGERWSNYAQKRLKTSVEICTFPEDDFPEERKKYMQLLVNELVIRDFFIARGGEEGIIVADRFDSRVGGLDGDLSYFPYDPESKEMQARDLLESIAREMHLPYVDVKKGRFTISTPGVFSRFFSDKEMLQLKKYGLRGNAIYRYDEDRELIFIQRMNCYIGANDYGAIIPLCFAMHPDGSDMHHQLEIGFRKRFGKKEGAKKRAHYYKLVKKLKIKQIPANLEQN